jgi:hypothetical protein
MLRVAAELGRIHAGAECGPCPRQHDACHRVVTRQTGERIRKLDAKIDRKGVALVRTLKRDHRHRIARLDCQQGGHGRSLTGGSAPRPGAYGMKTPWTAYSVSPGTVSASPSGPPS